MSEPVYDSAPDTRAHIRRVCDLIEEARDNLVYRANAHDRSKLEEPEKSTFDACTAKLKAMQYGSDEYKAALAELKPALDHHYAHNSHHPEHFPKRELPPTMAWMRERAETLDYNDPLRAHLEQNVEEHQAEVNGMSLFDVIEMLLDWKAATERMAGGGDIRCSLGINRERFKLSPQLESILANTIREMGW